MNPSQQRKIVVGFLGFGRIAHAILHRMISFGVTDVLFISGSKSSQTDYSYLTDKYFPQLRSIKRVTMPEVAQQSDVVFVLTYSNPLHSSCSRNIENQVVDLQTFYWKTRFKRAVDTGA